VVGPVSAITAILASQCIGREDVWFVIIVIINSVFLTSARIAKAKS
jgi:hypothetical protein